MAGEEDGEFAVAGEGLGEADGRGLGEREGEGDGEVVFAGLDDGAVVLDCVGLLVEEVVCGVAETEGEGDGEGDAVAPPSMSSCTFSCSFSYKSL